MVAPVPRPLLAGFILLLGPFAGAAEVDYARDIQPIFAEKCAQCHGPDESTREADLRLDDRDSAIASAIVPGDSGESELIRRINSDDPDEVMPPPDFQKPTTDEERKLLRQWVDAGAEYQQHWAFVPPVRPLVPVGQHPIDYFVQARLRQEGLTPTAEEDRALLLRRLSLDLTGLPPTVEQLDAFLADKSSDAYENQVDRFLESPHYGERWARWWLDAARYADSDGYEKDLPRQQWPWRDWVIGALNRDLPYDQFIIEQIAGDLLPNATQDHRVATGFLRNSMVNEEGAIIAEEFRIEALVDRMDCIGKSILGLTLSCVQCHDHKFDPVKQGEYYGMLAYINNDYEAVQKVFSDDQQKKMLDIERQVAEQDEEIKKAVPDWQKQLAGWVENEADKLAAASWTTLHPHSAEVPDGICHPEILSDGSVLNLGFRPTTTRLTVLVDVTQKNITGLRFEALNHGDLIFGGPGRSHTGCFAISDMVVDAASLDKPGDYTYVPTTATVDFAVPTRLIADFFRHTKDDRRMVGGGKFLTDKDTKTAWSPDRGARWRNQESQVVLKFDKPIDHTEGARLKITMGFRHGGRDAHGRTNNFIGRFKLSTTSDTAPVAANFTGEVRAALRKPASQRTEDDNRYLLWQWARSNSDAKQFASAIDNLWKKWPEGDSVLNLADRNPEHRRKTHVLERGSWQQPGEEVQAGVPELLHPVPADAPPNRITLARWLVDRKSPTTARVVVNRLWQAYFGTGLVSTAEDFGTRADPPSHPKVLDWLAVELMDPTVKTTATEVPVPWSLKHLHRVIVTSSTYRQSSRTTPELLERDPYNRLLARGPRFRSDAEMVRDIALTASGLLDREIGGPSVFPPVPEGMFALSFTKVDFWDTATGSDRYRRSLYVFRRRSIPDPVLASFDAPTGDSACVRRQRSNTPLAALTGLNATIFTEAAQGLALRIIGHEATTDSDRIRYGFRLCTGREPNEAEMATIINLLQLGRQRLLAGELKAADIAFNELTQPGDLPSNATPNEAAAWTIVARVLLNLDATISK
ncbi:MAG: PSD1 and planctomycete cytochrome C domain-containing protein [Planctomycetales bacterium]